MYIKYCPGCEQYFNLKHKPKKPDSLCGDCSRAENSRKAAAKKSKQSLIRTCKVCGKVSEVKHRSQLKMACCTRGRPRIYPDEHSKAKSRKYRNKNNYKIWYFCSRCPRVIGKLTPTKGRLNLCSYCKTKKKYDYGMPIDLVTMKQLKPKTIRVNGYSKYLRVCKCGKEEYVSYDCKDKLCKECYVRPSKYSVKKKQASKPKKSKTMLKYEIEKQRKINEKHREAEAVKAEETEIPKQKKSDKEFIEEFLKKKKPSVISHPPAPIDGVIKRDETNIFN